MRVQILHTNDFHGNLNSQKAKIIAEKRKSADFYFDCGDCVKAGNIGVLKNPDPSWDALNELNCNASVPGNREFHFTEKGFRSKINGANFPILCANLQWKNKRHKRLLQFDNQIMDEDETHPLPHWVIFGDVGVFGISVSMVTPRMQARHISAFVFEKPVESAMRCIELLRSKVKLLICLSHIGLKQDIELAEKTDGIDLILGGHSHDSLVVPLKIKNTWVCQAGSHGKVMGNLIWENGIKKYNLDPL